MKNFTYRSFEEKENIEAIIQHRRRKVNRQQIISACILIVVLGALGLYIAHHIFYTELDGYVSVDANRVRTPFDIYLDSVYVKTGDIVAPGDTLYSYYMLDMLVSNSDPNSEPVIVQQHRNYDLQFENCRAEIAVLKVRIEELRNQIALEDHNISFGLSQNSHKLDLQRALSEAVARLAALRHQLGVLARLKSATNPVFTIGHHNGINALRAQVYDNHDIKDMRNAVSYRLVTDSSIITQVLAPNHMVFFEKEEIVTKQHLNLEENNLQIVAYVPIDKMKFVTNNSKATIIVNDDIEYEATMSILGMRTDLIPENLRSYFSKKNTALIALFNLDPGQTIPFWSVASGLPVVVRIRNYRKWEKNPEKPDYLWFTTGLGVQTVVPDSLMHSENPHLVPLNAFLKHTDSLLNKPDTVAPVKPAPVKPTPVKQAPAKATPAKPAPAKAAPPRLPSP